MSRGRNLRGRLAAVAVVVTSLLVGAVLTAPPAFATGASAAFTSMKIYRYQPTGELILDDVSATITGYDGPTGICREVRPCSAVLEGRRAVGGTPVAFGWNNFYNGQSGPTQVPFPGIVNTPKIDAMRVTISGSLGTSVGDWIPVVDYVAKTTITTTVTSFDRDPVTSETEWTVTADIENYVSATGICTTTACHLSMQATFTDGSTEDIAGANLSAFSNQGHVDLSASGAMAPVASIQLRLDGADRTAHGQAIGVEDNAGPILDGESVGGTNPSENICRCQNGDPVNSATGEFYLAATDDTLPGKGPTVGVSRTYSSTNAASDGSFGYGWSDSFSSRLNVLQAGDMADPLPRVVQIVQENGSTVVFTENSSGHYVAPPRVLATLSFNSTTNKWTFVRRTVQTMTFDASGKILSSADPNGNMVTYNYSSGHVSSITGSGGRSVALTWSSGHISSLSDSAGRSASFSYNSSGNLTSATAVDGVVTHYGYGSGHYLTTTTAPEGGVTTNVYDGSHRVTSQTDALGRETTWAHTTNTTTVTDPIGAVTKQTYYRQQLVSATHAYGTAYATTTGYEHDKAGNTVAITDGTGAVTTFTYDSRGNQLTLNDPMGHVTTSTYNAFNRPTSVTDPLGRETTTTYDSNGNRLSQTSPGGHEQQWSYNPDGTADTSIDPRGKVTSFTYNTAGDLTSTTDPDSRLRSIAYDSAGHPSSTTDAAGKVTAFTTDAAGRVLTVTDPNSHTTTNTYDDDGDLLTTEDPNGHTITKTYDDADELVSRMDARGKTTTFAYTDAGLPASTTDPNNHTSTTAYNKLAQVVSITDALSHTTAFTYDDAGRELSKELPSGKTSSMTYDADGRMTSSTDGKGKVTRYVYDAASQLLSTTDPLGRSTLQTYTDDGHPDTTTLPDASTQVIGYNADGQQTGFTNADGKHTTYAYDDAGLLTSKTGPGGLVTGYSYDSAGRLHVTTKPDGTTLTDSHDDAGQLTREHSSVTGSTDITFGYDAAGQRSSMGDETGSTGYTYDAGGQMTAVTNGDGAHLAFGYDDAGRRTSITYPGSHVVSYGYDAADQLTSLTDWASHETDFTWTSDGELHTQADANGVTETRTYDDDNQTTAISDANSSGTLATYSYGYDSAGEISSDSRVDSTGSHSHSYSYDALRQLTTVDDGTSPASYAATSAGELTAATHGNVLVYNSAQQVVSSTPSSSPATSFAYDDNGSRVGSTVAASGGTPAAATSYSYDPQENLASATVPGTSSTTVDYTSDGDGLRQSRAVGSSTRQFLWDVSGSLPLLLDDGDHTSLYGPSSAPVAQVDDSTGTIQYLHGDVVGSTRLITSSSGVEAGTITYDSYGIRAGHTGSADSAIGYTGNWTDATTGLVYLRARDYDPATGQFTTVDPAVDTTRQPYAYVANDPLAAVDPTGMIEFPWDVWARGTIPGYGIVAAYNDRRKAGNDVYSSLVMTLDPVYSILEGDGNEISDVNSHCSGWQIFADGLEGVVGVAGTAGIAVGGAGAIGGFAAEGAGGVSSALGSSARSAYEALSPKVQSAVDDAVARAAQGKTRFPGHDGKPYQNRDGALPGGQSYREWTAAPAGSTRGADRVIVAGDPANPTAIYYWDHVNPPVRIGP